ncbi:MAG TPA: AAA family ATPase [Myxococcaceae bacterium]|nr:AAA family ATPase [Myxococcaceae bacterium]
MNRSSPRAYIEELRLSGFRAFENARLRLDDGLTVLVGHNGSGKSTLLDALEFVRDALSDSMENALDRRGGFQALLHRNTRNSDLSIVVKLRLPAGPRPHRSVFDPFEVPFVESGTVFRELRASYGFRLVPKRSGPGFAVQDEFAWVEDQQLPTWNLRVMNVPRSTLVLPLLSDVTTAYRALLVALRSGIRVYNLSPAAIRSEPPVGRASILSRSGDNAGDVLHHLQRNRKELDWLIRHLSAITPDIVSIKARTAAGRRIIQFTQHGANGSKSQFNIGDMSDGTLRGMAVLLSLRQTPTPALTCIEEIEDSVHPAALGVLLDAISASTERSQILLSSHSPEALSHPVVTPERVRVIEWHTGRSQIFLPSQGAHEMSKPPRSVGALLRTNALFPAKKPERIEGDIFANP